MRLRAKLLAVLVLLLGGLGYIGYRLATAPQWQQFRAERFWQSLFQVRLSYLLLAAAFVFSSYYLRSLRWQVFLRPLKRTGVGNVFVATLVGFSAVALLGRPGEMVRPFLIARKERVAVASQLGAWTLERVFDSVTVAAFLGAALLFFPPGASSGSTGVQLMGRLKVAGAILCVGALGAVAGLALLRYRAGFIMRVLGWLTRPFPQRHRKWIQTLVGHFSAGVASLESAGSLLASLGLSLMLWSAILLTYWTILHAPHQPLGRLDLGAVVLVLVGSVAGSVVHLPAVGGGTQVAMVLVLTELLDFPLDVASSAALLIWAWTFMLVLIPGLPLAAREGLNWQGLRSLARMKLEQESS
ncbi:MAG: flippase-like domain-containing protein [Acidobacteria bacterium]|nr:flippase-like domain-containing protein [Acidobacteriota bacterium]